MTGLADELGGAIADAAMGRRGCGYTWTGRTLTSRGSPPALAEARPLDPTNAYLDSVPTRKIAPVWTNDRSDSHFIRLSSLLGR
jgi:hypothetical protein